MIPGARSVVAATRTLRRTLSAIALTLPIIGQVAPPTTGSIIVVDAKPSTVTVYTSRASVTREATIAVRPGVTTLRFESLPASISAESIQARVAGAARVIGVEYEERPAEEGVSGRVAELDGRIAVVHRELEAIDRRRALVDAAEAFIDAVTVRATTDASTAAGSAALDLDAVRRQFEFVTAEREKLMTQRAAVDDEARARTDDLRRLEVERAGFAERTGLDRAALVTLAVGAAGPIDVTIAYLVSGAQWTPTYNVRAQPDGTAVTLEFDALLDQRSGEDWDGVAMTLSTAEPAMAANPPVLAPWFVDVTELPGPASVDDLGSPAVAPMPRARTSVADDAVVQRAGPSVTYALARRVTFDSDPHARQRARIATIELAPIFTHVAKPIVTEAVYVRGELINTSPYQLLPGDASIFVGSDYVGPTTLDAVAPSGRFELYFGIDQAVTIDRQLLNKTTAKTGLLGGGRRTSYAFRIEIANGAGKTINLELWDRMPVSRSDQIEVIALNISDPLDTSRTYLEEEQPLGMLKWLLEIPPTTPTGPPFAVTYDLRVVRAKDIEMTGLPE